MHGGIQEYIHRIGRTARIGNKGLATSFYNEKNEDIAQDLVNVLVECEQEIPEFLAHLKPEQPADIHFDDDSGDEAEAVEDGAGDAWGGGDDEDAAPSEPAETGFQADTRGFKAAPAQEDADDW
jgi:ATP-dependent RNA helicase DDX3X